MGSNPSLGYVCSPPEQLKKYQRICSFCKVVFFSPSVTAICCSDRCSLKFQEESQIHADYDRLTRAREKKKHHKSKREKKKKKRKNSWNDTTSKISITFAPPEPKKLEVKVTQKKEVQRAQQRYGKSFYTTEEWLRVRYQALKQGEGKCVACGNGRKEGVRLHVDHIKPRSKYPKLELELSNLQILCEGCNLGKSNLDETDWR